MIAVIQRVSEARVEVENTVAGRIGPGLLILLGVFAEDDQNDVNFLAEKITHFRIFPDERGNMNISIQDIEGEALVVSQFTLCGDWRKGRRPSFIHAAEPEMGKVLYQEFITQLKNRGIPTSSGIFGAMMDVHLVNQGPVTFVLDSRQR